MKIFPDRAIGAIYSAGFISGICRFPVWLLMALYFSTYSHLSYIDIGIIFTIHGLAPVGISPIAGRFSDRIGRKKLLLFSFAISEFAFLSMFVSTILNLNDLVVIIAFIGDGISTALIRTFNRAMLSDLIKGNTHIKVFGTQRIFSNAGIGIGMLVAGLAFESGPFMFFLLPIIGILAVIFIISMFVPETNVVKDIKNTPTPKILIGARTFGMFVLISIASLVAIMYMTPMFPLFFEAVDKFTPFQISMFLSINTLIVVIFQIPVNRFAMRAGEIATISIGLFIYGICYLFIGMIYNFYLVAFIIAIISIGENMVLPMGTVVVSKLAPADSRGYYMGLFSSISGIVIPTGDFGGTFMIQYFTVHSFNSWIVLLLLSLTIAIILPVYSRGSLRKIKPGTALETINE